MKQKFLVENTPLAVNTVLLEEDNDIGDSNAVDNDIVFDEGEDDLDAASEEPETSAETYEAIRTKYANFLNQLETVHHVSGMAVDAVVREITSLSTSIHSFSVNRLAAKLGKYFASNVSMIPRQFANIQLATLQFAN